MKPGDGMQGKNGLMLHQGTSRLGVMKRFFTKVVVKHWNTLPGEVVMVPNLLVLDDAVTDIVNFKVVPGVRSWA